MSEKVAEQIGKYADPNNFSGAWTSYMRIRVLIDVCKPIKRKMNIRRSDFEGKWINFRYERLPTFCFFCGIIGHSDRSCETVFEYRNQNVEKAYGVWLRASNRRSNYKGGEQWLLDGQAPALGGSFGTSNNEKCKGGLVEKGNILATQMVIDGGGGEQVEGRGTMVITQAKIHNHTSNSNPHNFAKHHGNLNLPNKSRDMGREINSKMLIDNVNKVGSNDGVDAIVILEAKRRRQESGTAEPLGLLGSSDSKENDLSNLNGQGSKNSVVADSEGRVRLAL